MILRDESKRARLRVRHESEAATLFAESLERANGGVRGLHGVDRAHVVTDQVVWRQGHGERRGVEHADETTVVTEHGKDARLLLYYTFDRTNVGEPIANLALPRDRNRDGAIILAEPVDGRWPGIKQALEFRRPGSRVRVNVPGEFGAFTFSCWARIDSLDRWYNALFMADRYETGEPHWQIRDDGKMMLSVMVDDARPDPKNPGGPPVRFQHLYFSPPMWNAAMSGQWLHLASVFDPAGGHVSHYVNGRRISREEIQPQYHIDTLRIGNAEVGNWGLPFREEPTFAIRNLNGRMDELAIFKTALTDEEIAKLFESSRARSE